MVPYFQAHPPQPEPRTLCWQHLNHAAIHDGNWKLVTLNDRNNARWELYDVSRDRSETQNGVEQHPDIVRRLLPVWQTWAKSADVLPFPEERRQTDTK